MNTFRFVFVYRDGTETVDYQTDNVRHGLTWLPKVENVHRAELIILVNVQTGQTSVLKNRWGMTGAVNPRQRVNE